ncbi:MAG: hypothetical protein WDZ35_01870 [Crocinitomicaceae bacterium]
MKKLLLLTFLSWTLLSCLKDKTQPVGGCYEAISYSTDIRPIIENSCKTQLGAGTGCHDAWIDKYDAIEGAINSGAWENEIFVEMTMPQIPNNFGIDSLTQDELTTMRCWIEQGYPEN